MDDVVICGQLRQIFPQVEPRIIQRTVEQAKTNEGVDILTHCIEVVLARQEAAENPNHGRQETDDVVLVKAIRKEKSNDGTKDIPLVFVKDAPDDIVHNPISLWAEQPQPFSDYDSDSIHSSNSDRESSDDEVDNPMNYSDNKCYFEGNNLLRNEFYDEQLDMLITNMQYSKPESELTPTMKTQSNIDKEHRQPLATPGRPTSTPFTGQHHSKTPSHKQLVGQPSATVGQPLATPSQHHLVTPGQQPLVKLSGFHSTTPSQHSVETLSRHNLETAIRQPSATPSRSSLVTIIETPSKLDTNFNSTKKVAVTLTRQPPKISIPQKLGTPMWNPLETSNQHTSVTLNEQNISNSLTSTATTRSLALDFIKQMYPRVNTEFVDNLSQQGYDLNGIVNMLLDRPDMQNSGPVEKQLSPKEPTQSKDINYFTDFSQRVAGQYSLQCETLLRNEFQRVSVHDIRQALCMFNNHYAPAHKLLEESLLDLKRTKNSTPPPPQNDTPSSTQKKKFSISRLLSNKRSRMKIIGDIEPELMREIDFVKEQAKLGEEKKNAIYAAHLNKQQYIDEGELIECGCCFGEFPFEEIVQCSDGHLFCKECLHGYAKEIIFGSAMTSVKLVCMGEDCDQSFPYNQLEKCLTKEEIEKYRGRLQEDCLAKADIPNLHQCPFCEFAAIIPERQKVFACLNPKCMKESCIDCNEEWKDHFGKKCNEIEKKSQTKLRLSYEERMTMAKVRKCSRCSLNFTKLDGCNKMTCRCGTTQCYVCRKSSINYSHFCRHPRDPGNKCDQCSACSLWTDPAEDDELAIKQLQEEAVVAKRKLMENIEQSTSKKKKLEKNLEV